MRSSVTAAVLQGGEEMATIELSTKTVKERIVIAYDPISSNKSRKGGDVEAQPGDTLGWQCANENQSFLVRFYRFDTGTDSWPFSQQPDKTVPGINPVRYLKVDSKKTKWVNVTSPVSLKYEVEVETGPAAEPLDPMIIIWPAVVSTDRIVFGVTCAVLGAIAGALLTALWS